MVEGPKELATTIWELYQEAAGATPLLSRLHDGEVRAKAHATVGVTWSEVEIDDGTVGSVCRVYGEGYQAIHLLIGSRLAELASVCIGLAVRDPHVDDRH